MNYQFVEAQVAGSIPPAATTQCHARSSPDTFRLTALTALRLVPPGPSSPPGSRPSQQAPRPPASPCYFEGYTAQRDQAWALIRLGLGLVVPQPALAQATSPGLLPASAFAPPKGLLLYGPRGTGKSLLLAEVAAALRPHCHVLHVSHEILLSK